MKLFKKLLCFLVLAALLLSVFAIPALAISSGSDGGYIWSKVSNDPAKNRAANRTKQFEGEEQDAFKPNDKVRVSILLEKPSTMERFGFSSSKSIASNNAATAYRASLLNEQKTLAARIEKTALNGQKLDVVWNLTLAANVISANILYKQIEDIEKVSGVAAVYVENEYSLDGAVDTEESPTQSTATNMTGSQFVWASGYTGAGSLVAVVDTGLDTEHELFNEDAFLYAIEEDIANGADVELLTEDKIAELLPQLNIATRNANISASDLYLSAKIPFAFNYSENNLIVNHMSDRQSEHGSHVTGIAAGNRYVPDGQGGFVSSLDAVKTQGQAPDAQVIVIKYFSARTGTDADYMAAIEDCILMGVDAVNLSLGSSTVSGLAINRVYANILKKIENSDLTMVCSGGNNGKWTSGLGIFGYLYSEDKNLSTGGSPGTYATSLAVASVDNDGKTGQGFTFKDAMILYTETSGYNNQPFATLFGSQEFVYVDSVGTDEEFAAVADVLAGKIAICNRGTTSFYQKANAAMANGAIGLIVANNTAGSISMNLTGYSYTAPCVSILQSDALYIKANATAVKGDGDTILYYTGSINVSEEIGSVSFDSDYYTLSSFSSWGTPGNLSLKPDITAPGGGIYSVAGLNIDENGNVSGGHAQYENMSGTSMAAPQVTGLVATLAQYIRETGLKEKTGLSERQLAQSLLMSTAVPMFQDGETYYPLMGQGSGLANLAAATQTKTLILMGEDATKSAADGKVKAEIGVIDEPSFSFTFNIQNFSDQEQMYNLYADFFTQDYFWYYVYDADGKPVDITTYLDDYTAYLESAVTWKVNGEEFDPEGNLMYDFNADGRASYSDIQVILDYAVGKIDEFFNQDYADINEDGNIDSYDAYLALDAINQASLTIAAGESAEVEISVDLLDIDDYYDKGAYVEGYVYVLEQDSEDGAFGVEHSIPVFGFYGDWTESSMFDHGSAVDSLTAEEELVPYMTQVIGSNAAYVKAFLTTYPGEDTAYEEVGNPVQWDYDEDGNPIYLPERNALNAETELTEVRYTQIRNAAAGRITVVNQDGDLLYEKRLGVQYAAHKPDGKDWQRTYTTQDIQFKPAGLAEEGDVLTATITLAPEYYYLEDYSIDWDALGEGASYSFTFTVDSTAPVIDAIDLHYDTKKGGFDRLDITATDNQFIAGVFVSTESGDEYGYFEADTSAEAEAGATRSFSLDFAELVEEGYLDSLADLEKHLLVEVYDYAGNLSTYKINLNPEELNQEPVVTVSDDFVRLHKNNSYKLSAEVTPWGVEDTVVWTSSDDTVATIDAYGVFKAVGEGTATIRATSTWNENAYAECTVEVFVLDMTLLGFLQDEEGYPYLFDYNLAQDDTWNYVYPLDTSVLNATMDLAYGYIYVQDFNGYIVKVDPNTLETVDVSEGTTGLGGPVDGLTMPHMFNYTNGTNMAFGIYAAYLLISEDIMDNDFSYGYNFSAYLRQYTKASGFVALGWGGVETDGSDILLALDNKGYIWMFNYAADGSMSLGYLPTTFAETAVAYEDIYMNSMVLGEDSEVYLSWFDGSTNVFYQLPFDQALGGFDSIRIDDVGPDVWPAVLLDVRTNVAPAPDPDPDPDPGTGDSFRKVPEWMENALGANLVASGLEAADIKLPTPDKQIQSINASLKDVKRQDENFTPLKPDSTELGAFILDVKADEASNNGLIHVDYDPELLRLVVLSTDAEFNSYTIGDGTVDLAYVDRAGYEADDSLLRLMFMPADEIQYTEILITYAQTNDQYSDEPEVFAIGTPLPHVHTLPEEAEWVWSDDHTYATATIVCEDCGEEIVLIAEIESETTPASYEAAGKIVYTATATFLDATYTDTYEEEIPALEYTFGEPYFVWADDYTVKAYVDRNDGEKIEIEASVTSDTTAATHAAAGKTVYTAKAEYNGEAYTSVQEVEIPAVEHSFGQPVWIWSDDLSLAAATFSCACGESVTILATVSAVTENDIITVTAKVTFGGTDYQDVKTKEVEKPKETAVVIIIDSVNGTQPGEISIYFSGADAATIAERTSTIEEIDYLLGDISGNGEIDAADYLMARRNVLGTLDLSEDQFKRGDVNRNDEIEILDYTMIKQHVLGTFTIQQPEPEVIPGPDFADSILICVDSEGLVKSVNAEAGADKSATEIPEFGYILSVPIDKFAPEQLQYLKESVGIQLAGIDAADYQDAGLDVVIEDEATATYSYTAE